MSAPKSPAGRYPARVMLAHIALAGDLPVPVHVSLYDDLGLMGLTLATVADGLAWAKYLGADQAESYVRNGRRYLDQQGVITWHGWTLNLNAAEPTTCADQLDPDTAAHLAALIANPQAV